MKSCRELPTLGAAWGAFVQAAAEQAPLRNAVLWPWAAF